MGLKFVALGALLVLAACNKIERRIVAFRDATSQATQSEQAKIDGLQPIGCSLKQTSSGIVTLQAFDGRGRHRTFEVLLPDPAEQRIALPVTFVFHGANGNAKSAQAMGLQDVPGAKKSIFVFPEGAEYEQGKGWDDTCNGRDIVFFDRMLTTIRHQFCVDEKRVFAAGFSWGADFVTALLCCRSDRLRAAAPASCSDEFSNPADYRTYANYPCPRSGHAAIRFTHDANGDPSYTKLQFAATRRLYGEWNGCVPSVTNGTAQPCVEYEGCRTAFTACAYESLGHNVPARWASETWGFFSGAGNLP